MLHSSTVPIPNVKLKRVSKVYRVLYNNSAEKKTMSKRQRTKEFKIIFCALLYSVHMATYNISNYKFPYFLIMRFYRLVRFHTRRRFRASISDRVSDAGHPVTYARKEFTNKPGHKIYRCMSKRST